MNTNTLARAALAALLLGSSFAVPAEAKKREFHCVGVGRGGHAKGMSASECRKAGGTVEYIDAEESGERAAPRAQRREPSRESRESEPHRGGFLDRVFDRGARQPERSMDRSDRPAQQSSFSCRGIGTGRHYPGMTEAECRRMGGTVEEPRR